MKNSEKRPISTSLKAAFKSRTIQAAIIGAVALFLVFIIERIIPTKTKELIITPNQYATNSNTAPNSTSRRAYSLIIDSSKIQSRKSVLTNQLHDENQKNNLKRIYYHKNGVKFIIAYSSADEETQSPFNSSNLDLYQEEDGYPDQSWVVPSNKIDSIALLVNKRIDKDTLDIRDALSLYAPNLLPGLIFFYISNLSGSRSPDFVIRNLFFKSALQKTDNLLDSVTIVYYGNARAVGSLNERMGRVTIMKENQILNITYKDMVVNGENKSYLYRERLKSGEEVAFAIEIHSELFGQYILTLDLHVVFQYTIEEKTIIDTLAIDNFAVFNVALPKSIKEEWVTDFDELKSMY